jgi:UDP-N-acetylglucosamine 2-epimerase (non-hydrolysing)
MPIRIVTIFGTRPEAIKLAPVIRLLARDGRFASRVCVTAQHREMLDQVLAAFDIVPDVDLDLMRPAQTLGAFTARAIEALDAFFAEEKPDLALVQGDTTTVFCAALAAFYHQVPLGHVEAGLRTGDLAAPWPEEANRVLTTRLTALHFAPTALSRENLLREGVPAERIFVTGNTVVDALFLAREKVRAALPAVPQLPADRRAAWGEAPRILITGHRRESFGEAFESICRAIAELARRFPRAHFIYPVHLNPNVRRPVMKILGGAAKKHGNVHLIEPLPYLPFVQLIDEATLILTDSGGIQEEAPSLGKPVLVMRETTERPEGIEAGTVKLVGTSERAIVEEVERLLTDPGAYRAMATAHNPYGDGHAAERIVAACGDFFRAAAP